MTMLQTATSELGVVEGKGAKNDPRVLEYEKVTGFSQDSVPWCGSFVAWNAKQNGIPFNRSKAAAAIYWATDWVTEGSGKFLKAPIPGAIGVKKRVGGNHVFFFVRWIDKKNGIFEALGGNQGGGKASGHDGAVTLTKFNASDVLAWTWPVKVPIPSAQKPIQNSTVGGTTISLAGGGALVAGVAPSLGEAIKTVTSPPPTTAEIIQDSGGSLVEAVQKSKESQASGTIFGAAVAIIIIAAAVWVIVNRINNAAKERKTLES